MTFPVGPLPNAGQTISLSQVKPVKSVLFTHGGTDLDLTNTYANGGLDGCSAEFYCTVSGNLLASLVGDASVNPGAPLVQTYPVTAGQVIYGLFVLAKSTSTANGIFRT
jgi:hypothetical protein